MSSAARRQAKKTFPREFTLVLLYASARAKKVHLVKCAGARRRRQSFPVSDNKRKSSCVFLREAAIRQLLPKRKNIAGAPGGHLSKRNAAAKNDRNRESCEERTPFG
jgi:hypothetical protein